MVLATATSKPSTIEPKDSSGSSSDNSGSNKDSGVGLTVSCTCFTGSIAAPKACVGTGSVVSYTGFILALASSASISARVLRLRCCTGLVPLAACSGFKSISMSLASMSAMSVLTLIPCFVKKSEIAIRKSA